MEEILEVMLAENDSSDDSSDSDSEDDLELLLLDTVDTSRKELGPRVHYEDISDNDFESFFR